LSIIEAYAENAGYNDSRTHAAVLHSQTDVVEFRAPETDALTTCVSTQQYNAMENEANVYGSE